MRISTTRERAHYGYIITAINTTTNQTETRHIHGYSYETGSRSTGPNATPRTKHGIDATQTLLDYIHELEQRPDPWKIRTLSNPDTILTDLKGRNPTNKTQDYRSHPEASILARIGQLHMYEHANRC